MIRMVNLSCRKCGMSIDFPVDHIDAYCPSCGGPLTITVKQMQDILSEKKNIRQKGVTYETGLDFAEDRKPKPESKWAALLLIFGALLALVLALLKTQGVW